MKVGTELFNSERTNTLNQNEGGDGIGYIRTNKHTKSLAPLTYRFQIETKKWFVITSLKLNRYADQSEDTKYL